MKSASTAVPNFEIGFVDPEIVAVSVPVTNVVSLPNETVLKLGRAERPPLTKVGTSTIHSAELLAAPGIAAEFENDFLVVTSLIETVNFAVVVEYFTLANIVSPGLIVSDLIVVEGPDEG